MLCSNRLHVCADCQVYNICLCVLAVLELREDLLGPAVQCRQAVHGGSARAGHADRQGRQQAAFCHQPVSFQGPKWPCDFLTDKNSTLWPGLHLLSKAGHRGLGQYARTGSNVSHARFQILHGGLHTRAPVPTVLQRPVSYGLFRQCQIPLPSGSGNT